MKMQQSSKELRFCTQCDLAISRTESRYVDGCLHQHLSCHGKVEVKPGRRTFIEWLCMWLAK